MNTKIDIQNPRFELTTSAFEGYKEVQVIFNYKGKEYKHSVFIKEGKDVDYINEAKKQFEKDIRLCKMLEQDKDKSTNHHLWVITLTSVAILGAVALSALTLVGILVWKVLNNQTPTTTNCVVKFESNGGDPVETKKVKSGTTIAEPEITKINYTFGGWYEQSDFSGERFNFNTAINKDYTFYAKWLGGPAPTSYTLIVNAGEDAEFSNGATSISINVAPDSNLLENLSVINKPIYKGDKLSQTFDQFTHIGGGVIGNFETVNEDNMEVIGTYRNKTLEECSWSEIAAISNQGKEFAKSYFGPIIPTSPINKTVMVNNQPHTVRIIGYGQDVDENGNEVGITFEFANLISDDNGYSLAAYWNDVASSYECNNDYTDSTIRAVLNGNDYIGGSTKDINWFQYFGTEYDDGINKQFSETYSGKSVLDMLPSDLSAVLKTVKKQVNIKTDGTWIPTEFNDKLFLLNPKELGYIDTQFAEDATPYNFYEGHTESTDAIRVKAQVKGADGARTEILSGVDLDGKYTEGIGIKFSYAGYHYEQGADFWLRSPVARADRNTDISWSVGSTGYVNDSTDMDYCACNYAYGVAPAFCI